MNGSSSSPPPLLEQVLSRYLKEPSIALSPDKRQSLANQILSDSQRARAFGITPSTIEADVNNRLEWLRSVYSELDRFCCTQLGWNACPLATLWDLWLPIAIQIAAAQQDLGRVLIQGISGGQGTGKTTLTLILGQILNLMGYPTCHFSIDDLYKTYAERQQLQHDDPRFRWRGPPGTHDVKLGLSLLHQLRQAVYPVAIPRFDKSAHRGAGDRTIPERVRLANIVLFEGWFVGMRPLDPIVFETAPPPIVTDADRAFACEINQRLYEYLPLWDQLDRLIVLYPTDYRLSQHWRQQAEQEMIASGKSGMGEWEIHEFVEYFWRSLHPQLFIPPLLQDADHVNLVIEINADHVPQRVYCP
jgi:D-glycerate 3-kinase